MMPDGNEGLGQSPLLSIVLLGALTLLPFVFMTTTSFVKISVVFSILRNALGTGQVPSGMVISALAAILSLYVMAPVGEEMIAAAAPATAQIDTANPLTTTDALFEAVELGFEPLRQFLERNSGRDELLLFRDLRRQSGSPNAADVTEHDVLVVLPSFVITELSEAFQIGFLIFLPFLVIDMVVANVLLALGMQMLNPTQVSMPFKLLLFVLVNGWFLLSRALVLGYV
jgi:type III secretion protein R